LEQIPDTKGVVRCRSFDDLARAVGGMVVDDDQLDASGLADSREARERVAEVACAVRRADDDRDVHSAQLARKYRTMDIHSVSSCTRLTHVEAEHGLLYRCAREHHPSRVPEPRLCRADP